MTRNYNLINYCLTNDKAWEKVKAEVERRTTVTFKAFLRRSLIDMMEQAGIEYQDPDNAGRGDYSKEFKGGPV